MLKNTATSYGRLARLFHWSIALMMLSVIPLGVIAHDMPYDTGAQLARKATLFSLHKTLGVAIFFLALARIIWALRNPKPAPLHPERRLETLAADTAHWLLYGALIIMPLTGWIGHAAAEGFAPIWWPLGQSLPFIPKSTALVEVMAHLHIVSRLTLILALLAHIAGALKHHLWDRDTTLRRMMFGTDAGEANATTSALPLIGAALIWAATLGAGLITAPAPAQTPTAPQITSAAPEFWQVQSGDIAIQVVQFDEDTNGRFATWQSQIAYDPGTGTGQVRTQIDITSLSLGSVTDQALKPAYFDAETYPQAVFKGDITRNADTHRATGTLTLKGITLPVSFPFDLSLSEGTAEMSATLTLDRQDFGIGDDDTETLLPEVKVKLSLTATAPQG